MPLTAFGWDGDCGPLVVVGDRVEELDDRPYVAGRHVKVCAPCELDVNGRLYGAAEGSA